MQFCVEQVLVSLFNGISTFISYLMSKSSLQKNSSDTLTYNWGIEGGFHIFPKGISLKVNVIM